MAQWKDKDLANNSVNYGARLFMAGSGKSNIEANNTALYNNVSPSAFVGNLVVGQFGVSVSEIANTDAESKKVSHAGWAIRKAGQGPIETATVTGGTGFANGETITVSGGSVNATLTITSNGTGNLASATITTNGLFPNVSGLTKTFNREKHLTVLTVTGGSGYNNSDYIVVSNSTINATANIVTDGSGTFINSGITISNSGIFPNARTNTGLVIAVKASNGAASNGTSASLSGGLINSSGGAATITLGGRAGRVHYETLVAFGMANNGTSDDTYLPQT